MTSLIATDSSGYRYQIVPGVVNTVMSGTFSITSGGYVVLVGQGGVGGIYAGGGSGGFCLAKVSEGTYSYSISGSGTTVTGPGVSLFSYPGNSGNLTNHPGWGGNGGGGGQIFGGGNGGDLSGNIGNGGSGSPYNPGLGGSSIDRGGGGGGALRIWGNGGGTEGLPQYSSNAYYQPASNFNAPNIGYLGWGGGGGGGSGWYSGDYEVFSGGGGGIGGALGGNAMNIFHPTGPTVGNSGEGYGAGGGSVYSALAAGSQTLDSSMGGGGGGMDPRILYLYAHSLQSGFAYNDENLTSVLANEAGLNDSFRTYISASARTSNPQPGAIFFVEMLSAHLYTTNGILYKLYNGNFQMRTLDFVQDATLSTLLPFSDISSYTFAHSPNLSLVNFPSSLSSIQENVFSSCTNLSSIAFPSNSMLSYIGAGAFANTLLTTVTLPPSFVGNGLGVFAGDPLSTIQFASNSLYSDPYGFSNLVQDLSNVLESIQIPASLQILPDSIFSNFPLQAVTFQGNSQIQKLSTMAFFQTNLRTIFFPDTLATFGYSTFGMTSLSTILVNSTFAYFSNLTQANIGLPSSQVNVFTIGIVPSEITDSCEFPVHNLYTDAFQTNPTVFQEVLQNSQNPIVLTDVNPASLVNYDPYNIVPTSVTLNCIGVRNGGTIRTSQLSESSDNRIVNYLTLGVGDSIFFDAYKATLVSYSELVVYNAAPFETTSTTYSLPGYVTIGTKSYNILATGSLFLNGIPFSTTAGVLYNTLDANMITNHQVPYYYSTIQFDKSFAGILPITQISSYCFADSPNLSTVMCLSSIQAIDSYAFFSTPNLTSFVVSNNSQLSTIGDYAFAETNLTSFVFPSAFVWNGVHVFSQDNLVRIDFAPNSQYNDPYAFSNLVADLSGTLQSVTIPKSLGALVDNTFSNFPNLSSVMFQDNSVLSTIGSNVFYGCTSLQSLDFAKTQLTYIGNHGFASAGLLVLYLPSSFVSSGTDILQGDPIHILEFASNSQYSDSYGFSTLVADLSGTLQSVTIPKSLGALVDNTFSNFPSLSAVVFQDNSVLSTIGSNVFYECASLQSLDCAKTQLTYIGDHGFASAGIQSIYFPSSFVSSGTQIFQGDPIGILGFASNSQYSDSYGFSTLVGDLSQTLHTITIPDTLGALISGCFSNFLYLSNITLGNPYISTIDRQVFYGCTSLHSMDVSRAIKLQTIGDQAFASTGMIAIQFPSSFVSSGTQIFQGCTSLNTIGFDSNSLFVDPVGFSTLVQGLSQSLQTITIPTNLGILPPGCFSNYSNLTNVYMGNTHISTIGQQAMYGCTSLYTIDLTSANHLQTIGNQAFAGTNLQTIQFPSSFVSTGFEIFLDVPNLQTIGFDSNSLFVDPIGFSRLVQGLSQSLQTIAIPTNLGILPPGCFSNYSNLTNVYLENTHISTIGQQAFYGCTSLYGMNLSSTTYLQTIGDQAFAGTNLQTIQVPSSFVSSGSEIFLGVTNLQTIGFDSNSQYSNSYGFSTLVADLSLYLTTITIPEQLGTLVPGCFSNFPNLSNVLIGYSHISTIGKDAFYGCPNIYGLDFTSSLLRNVGDRAFANTNLTSFQFPSSFVSSGTHIFQDDQITNLQFQSNSLYADPIGFSNLVQDISGTLLSVALPKSLGALAPGTFANFPSLELVIATESIELSTIGAQSFSNCAFLTAFVAKTPRLSSIQDQAFLGCTTLNQLDFTTAFDLEKFSRGTTLPSIIFPSSFANNGVHVLEGVSTVHMNFESNSLYADPVGLSTLVQDISGTLQTIHIPYSLPSILDNTFSKFSSLTSVTFEPASHLSSIGNSAFSFTPVTSIQCPNNLSSIGAFAFDSCSSLGSVFFANTSKLSYIGDSAFTSTNMYSIHFPPNFQKQGSNMFAGTPLQNLYFLSNSKYSDPTAFQTLVSSLSETLETISIPFMMPILIDELFANLSVHNVSIPANGKLGQIRSMAFFQTGIESVYFPNSLSTIGISSFGNTPLSIILLESNFPYFSQLTQPNLGVPSSQVSIYSLGPLAKNTTCDFPIINLYTTPPTDKPTFDKIVKVYSLPISLFFSDMPYISSFATNDPEQILGGLPPTTELNAVGCTNGSILDISYLVPDPDVVNYLTVDIGDYFYFNDGSIMGLGDASTIYYTNPSYVSQAPSYFFGGMGIVEGGGGGGPKGRFAIAPNAPIPIGPGDGGGGGTTEYPGTTRLHNWPYANYYSNTIPFSTIIQSNMFVFAASGSIFALGCVLEGTLVRTPCGDVPIETLRIGDSITNQKGKSVRINYVEHSEVKFTTCPEVACLKKLLYKVPKGLHGAERDLFVTRNHEIVMPDGTLEIPERCGAVKALQHEIHTDNGWYHVYHLGLDEESHFLANGCLITSLGSSTKCEPTGPPKKEVCKDIRCLDTMRHIT